MLMQHANDCTYAHYFKCVCQSWGGASHTAESSVSVLPNVQGVHPGFPQTSYRTHVCIACHFQHQCVKLVLSGDSTHSG